MKLSRVVLSGGLFWVTMTSSVFAQTPTPYDSGLTEPFITPAPVTGRTLSVTAYNENAIRTALNTAVAGDEIYLPDGLYTITSGDIPLKSGVSIRGQSRIGTILQTSLTAQPYAVFTAAQGTTNFTLSHFSINLNPGTTPTKSGIRLGTGTPINDNSTYLPVTRVRLDDLLIEGYEKFGVQLENTIHVEVQNSLIRNAAALGDGGQGYGIMVAFDQSRDNWFHDNDIGPVIRHGILMQYRAHHNLVEHNTVYDTVSDAIDFHGEDEYSNEVRYNTVSNCPQNYSAGIGVGEFSGTIGSTTEHDNSGPHNWIHHNEVYNCVYGLRIVNNSNYTYIEDNSFHHNVTAGVQADLAPMDHIYFFRNIIQNNPQGVRLTDVTYAYLESNTITQNLGYGLWTNLGTTNYYIVGNTITNNGINVYLGSPNGYYSSATPTPTPLPTVSPSPTPSATPAPATDLDGDIDTDLRDLLQFLGFFGGTGQGDFNNSGRVDVFDFSLLVANFGR